MIHILKSIFVISSFLLISTQTSISQPVDFDFMYGWGVDNGDSEFQICTSATTPCLAGISDGGAGQFDNPIGIAVDSMKNIYVADTGNDRIQVFDLAGNFLFMFGSSGGGDGQFTVPTGIAVDSMKNIYVTDIFNDRIQVFDSAGIFLFMFGWGVAGGSEFEICTSSCQIGSPGGGAGQFDFPRGVAVDSMKNIYVADTSNNRIQVFSQPPPIIPTLSEWGLIAMAGILGIVGYLVIRRRKVTA